MTEQQKIVEVFKTNVTEKSQADSLIHYLLQHFPGSRINFDLDDCDKVLRIEGQQLATGTVIMLVQQKGFDCAELN